MFIFNQPIDCVSLLVCSMNTPEGYMIFLGYSKTLSLNLLHNVASYDCGNIAAYVVREKHIQRNFFVVVKYKM